MHSSSPDCDSKYLQVGDLILLLAKGENKAWSPDSVDEPYPSLGYLSSTPNFECIDAHRYMNHVAKIQGFRGQSEEPQHLDDCIFQVQAAMNGEDIMRAKIVQQFNNMENQSRKAHKKIVQYGESIQLLHYRTGQTLYINVNDRGDQPFTMKIGFEYLQDINKSEEKEKNGPATQKWFDSWLEISSPVQTHHIGDPVCMDDVMFFRSDRWKRYLHVFTNRQNGHHDSSEDKIEPTILNVEASFTQSRWCVVPFCAPFRNSNHHCEGTSPVYGNSILRLFHVENEGFLYHFDFTHLGMKELTGFDQEQKQKRSQNSSINAYHIPGQVALGISSSAHARQERKSTSSNSMWIIEPLKCRWGGMPLRSGDHIRLRHYATNFALACRAVSSSCPTDSHKSTTKYEFYMLDDSIQQENPTLMRETVFRIFASLTNSSTNTMLTYDTLIQIQHEATGIWIHRAHPRFQKQHSYDLSFSATTSRQRRKQKSGFHSKHHHAQKHHQGADEKLIRLPILCSRRQQDSDYFAMIAPAAVEIPRLLHITRSWKCVATFGIRLAHVVASKGIDAVQYVDVQPIEAVYRSLRLALTEVENDHQEHDRIRMKFEPQHTIGFATHAFQLTKIQHYQDLLREQLIMVDFLRDMTWQTHAQRALDDEDDFVSSRSRSTSITSKCTVEMTKAASAFRNPALRLMKRECFSLVSQYVKNHEVNQLTLSDFVDYFELMVSTSKRAAGALTEIVRENRWYLEQVSSYQIQNILLCVQKVGLVAEYLRYLETLCQRKGHSFRPNQLLILEELVEKRSMLLPQYRMDRHQQVEVYIPIHEMKKNEEITTVSNWQTMDESMSAKHRSYVIQSYHLLARLCQGRHLRAQELVLSHTKLKLDYCNLLKLIENPTLLPEFRISVIDLMIRLHIDRAPQFFYGSCVNLMRYWKDPQRDFNLESLDDKSGENHLEERDDHDNEQGEYKMKRTKTNSATSLIDLSLLKTFVAQFLHSSIKKLRRTTELKRRLIRTSSSLSDDSTSTKPETEDGDDAENQFRSSSWDADDVSPLHLGLLTSVLTLCKSLTDFGQYRKDQDVRAIFTLLLDLLLATEMPLQERQYIAANANALPSASSSATMEASFPLEDPQQHSFVHANSKSPHFSSSGKTTTSKNNNANQSQNSALQIQMKFQVCEILHELQNCRLNNQLTYLLMHIREKGSWFDEDESDFYYDMEDVDLEKVFQEMIVNPSVEMTYPDYSLLLWNLCLHGNNRLTSLSQKVLTRGKSQLVELSKIVSRTQLFVTEKSLGLFLSMRDTHAALTAYIQLQGDQNFEQKQLIVNLLRKIRRLLTEDHQQSDGKRLQKIVTNLGIHTLLMDILRKASKNEVSSSPSSSAAMSALQHDELRYCYQILETLLNFDTEFQTYLFSEIDLLISHIPKYPIDASKLARAILNNNRELVSGISFKQIQNIVRVLNRQRYDDPNTNLECSRVLEILYKIILLSDGPVQQNQNAVLRALLQSSSGDILKLYQGQKGYNQRVHLMEQLQPEFVLTLDAEEGAFHNDIVGNVPAGLPTRDDDNDDKTEQMIISQQLRYHIQLLHVLTACSLGKSHFAEVQCRSLVSLKELVQAIEDDRTILPVRNVIFKFWDALYLDIFVPIPGFGQSPFVWRVLHRCATELQTVFDSEDNRNEQESPQEKIALQVEFHKKEMICKTICPILRKYYLQLFNHNSRTWQPDEIQYLLTLNIFYTCCDLQAHERCGDVLRTELLQVGEIILQSDPKLDHMEHELVTAAARSNKIPTKKASDMKQSTLSPRFMSQLNQVPVHSPWERLEIAKTRQNFLPMSTFSFQENDPSNVETREDRQLDETIRNEEIRHLEDQISGHMRAVVMSLPSTSQYQRVFKQASVDIIRIIRRAEMDATIHMIICHLDSSYQDESTTKSYGEHLQRTSAREVTFSEKGVLLSEIRFLRAIVEAQVSESGSTLSEADQIQQQCRLSRLGASVMLLKLIALDVRKHQSIVREALRLGITLLKHGNKQVQQAMYDHLRSTALDEPFFAGLVSFIRNSVERSKSAKIESMIRGGGSSIVTGRAHPPSSSSGAPVFGRSTSDSSSFLGRPHSMFARQGRILDDNDSRAGSESSSLVSSAMSYGETSSSCTSYSNSTMYDVLEFVRLLCEDHFEPMQNYLRVQPDNFRSHNVVDEVVSHLRAIQWVVDPKTNTSIWNVDAAQIDLCYQLMYSLIEFAQGCEENQLLLSSQKLIHAVNDFLSQDYVQLQREDFIPCATSSAVEQGWCEHTSEDLKCVAILLLYSIVEGNNNPQVAFNVLKYLNLKSIQRFCRHHRRQHDAYEALLVQCEVVSRSTLAAVPSSSSGPSDDECVPTNSSTRRSMNHPTLDTIVQRFEIDSYQRDKIIELDEAWHQLESTAGKCTTTTTLESLVKSKLGTSRETCFDVLAAVKTVEHLARKGFHEQMMDHHHHHRTKTTRLHKSEDDEDREELVVALQGQVAELLDHAKAICHWPAFQRRVGCVEILRKNRLERVYFPIPEVCLAFWDTPSLLETRHKMKYLLARENQVDKLEYLHNYSQLVVKEMNYRAHLSTFPKTLMILNLEHTWMNLSFVLAIGINLLNIVTQEILTPEPRHHYHQQYQSHLLAGLSLLAGLAHVTFTSIRTYAIIVSRKEALLNDRRWHEFESRSQVKTMPSAESTDRLHARDSSSLWSDGYFLSTKLLYHVLYLSCSALGFLTTAIAYDQSHGLRLVIYTFTLLDICVRNRTLSSVLSAVQASRRTFIQTFYLIVVVVFIFAAMGFAFFQDHYQLEDVARVGCRTLMECVVTHFNHGLRGHVADSMLSISWGESHALSIGRLVFDVAYWMVIHTLLLGIISAILVDAFADERRAKSSTDKDMESKCFICGIDSIVFQRYGNGFNHHVRMEHNLWQYIFLREYLNQKQKSEFTSQETYVWKKIQNADLSYYPNGKAIALENYTASEFN